MTVITDKKRINEIFDRGIVAEILPSRDALMEKLYSGERLSIYIGADPTSTALHLSHAKNYMFLEELRALGHEVIVLIGDFTARIGDPSGRNTGRPPLTEEDVKKNVEGWMKQIHPLMNFDDKDNPPRLAYNSAWLAPLSLSDVVGLAAHFTVQQMLERDMFEKRMREGNPIYLHEFLYPLMQGYDSVALDVNVELCGTDQIFNALAGRTLMKRLKNKDKFIIAVNLMENPKTGELMSKSKGAGVFLDTGPEEMYGAIMAQPDEMIEPLFINCTRIPLGEKDALLSEGPRQAKARVALDIVARFYGRERAQRAEAEFEKIFRTGGVPDDIPEITITSPGELGDQLIAAGIIKSKTEWHRLIADGAIRNKDGVPLAHLSLIPSSTIILKIGKRRFVRIVVG
ncbi:MAG: tyrosine--tRNA ligase [Patescibacteria group bacterium]